MSESDTQVPQQAFDDRIYYHSRLTGKGTLQVDRMIAQAVGLNGSIVLRQVEYWLERNEETKKTDNFRDGCWWTYNTYESWQDENFDFWSYDTVRRTFHQLVGLGLLYEGNYNKRKNDQTKWYTINYGAYYAFMRLWRHHKRPKACGGNKNPAYAAFLEDWNDKHKGQYNAVASCGQRLQDADAGRKLPGALPDTTDTTQNKKTESRAKRRTPKTKPASKSNVVPFRKDYEDVAKDTRRWIINAWVSNLEAQPIGAFDDDGNHSTAAMIHRAGYTDAQVEAYVKWTRTQPYWRGKTLTLQKVAQLLPQWVVNHKADKSGHVPVVAPPTQEEIDRDTDSSRFRRFDANGKFLGYGREESA
jgi:hypothetical protein